MEMKLPSFDIPQTGYDLISEFMRIRGIKSRSRALAVLLSESLALREIAGRDDIKEEFGADRTWGRHWKGDES